MTAPCSAELKHGPPPRLGQLSRLWKAVWALVLTHQASHELLSLKLGNIGPQLPSLHCSPVLQRLAVSHYVTCSASRSASWGKL